MTHPVRLHTKIKFRVKIENKFFIYFWYPPLKMESYMIAVHKIFHWYLFNLMIITKIKFIADHIFEVGKSNS